MNQDAYLKRLNQQLSGFSEEERACLLEEVASHIEDATQDPGFSPEPAGRAEKMAGELGSPEDMGRGFKEVYRPARWIDFLLAFIPIYGLFPLLLPWLVKWLDWIPANATDAVVRLELRLAILLGLAFALFSIYRRSPYLMAFWVPDVMTRLISLMTGERRWIPGNERYFIGAGVVESLVWWCALIVMGIWLARFLWLNRKNMLLVLFALQPFILTLFNVISFSFTTTPHFPDWRILWFGAYNLITALSLAGIFLLPGRTLRWLALLAAIGMTSLEMAYAFWPLAGLSLMWMAPTLIYLVAWVFDKPEYKTRMI